MWTDRETKEETRPPIKRSSMQFEQRTREELLLGNVLAM
jgi:hypothetical protein